MNEIDFLRRYIDESQRIVGFTGAGISTESGIPDYRSKGGIWNQFQPVYFQEFLDDEEKRILYWQRKIESWPAISTAMPGPGQKFFTDLYKTGKLSGLITQNVDGLHEKSGLPQKVIVNLHGNSLETICLSCGLIIPSATVFATRDLREGAPRCHDCGGLLKPNTISFGQSLRQNDLKQSDELARNCDLIIAMGSTLIVHPAAAIPRIAKENGAKLVIITLSETPLDAVADLVINRKIGEVVQTLGAGPGPFYRR
ncbi:MAG: sigma factor regulator FecR [Spirochaetales bacterium]|jgi:NAD-dependent deacetylase|nr:sigma factor regulator FecR [Spirochaetales bacterium]